MTSSILDSTGQPYRIAHAADRSTRRGPQFTVLNDDIDRLIPSNDRKTLVSLSNRLFVNMGVPRACILQKADYSVGEAWLPSYLGADQEKGKQVTKFLQDVWYPQSDVRGGIFDWHKILELSSVEIDRSGDVFWILVVGADNFPRIQMIPSHRCRSAYDSVIKTGDYAGYRINDGIIYFRSGRPAAYRFDVGVDGVEQFKDIPAADVIHLFDPSHCEQGRGLPAFTHALESLKMSLLSTEDERIRQQIISRLHLTVFNATGAPDIDDPANDMDGGGLGTSPTAFSTQSFPGGVMYLPGDGQHRMEQMEHKNPGPNWDTFQDRLNREAVIPVWSYNVWKSSGQGTAERGEIVKCRRFVTKRQGQLFYAARRAVSWAYSVFAAAGRLPKLEAPTLWDFSRPPRLSVDDGRESKMELEELRAGSRNLSEVLEARGLNETDFLTSRAHSIWMRKHIAHSVADKLNATHGMVHTVEDREMFMITPNEVAEVQTAVDDNENQYNANGERLRFENLKSKFDAYGVAVRAGAITPAVMDEETFRAEAGLPNMSPAVLGAWKEDKGFRRPITLASPSGFKSPSPPQQPIED